MIFTELSPWSFHMPVRVTFGEGCLTQLPNAIFRHGLKPLVVSNKSILRVPMISNVMSVLHARCKNLEIIESITREPTSSMVEDVAAHARAVGADMLIGIGGGSAMDAAKAASVLVANPELDLDSVFAGHVPLPSARIPVVLVPTTAGTGAELSRGAILQWVSKGIKIGLRGESLFATEALVDPLLTAYVPVAVKKTTGFDVFCHAVETFLSRVATPLTSRLSEDAIVAVCQYLPQLIAGRNTEESLRNLSYYSMLMGFNLANSSTCLPHRLQYPLGVLTNTPHALGLAALYPTWFSCVASAVPGPLHHVAGLMRRGMMAFGLKILDTESPEQVLREFMASIDLSPRLGDFSVDNAMCVHMAGMVEGSVQNDPAWYPGMDFAALYRLALTRK